MSWIPLALCLMPLAQAGPETGSLGGRVVNETRQNAPASTSEVFLQVQIEGTFEVIGRAIASAEGRFLFEGIPLDEPRVYRAGASLDDVFYPGPRITLSAERPAAEILLKVRECSHGPSPLILRSHEILVVPESGALRVTETLRIENPEPVTFVGPPQPDGSDPITLELRIPPSFERVTFHEEFYGRQFTMREGRLVTSIPWTPGRRELTFTYVMPDEGDSLFWQRRLDLPCDHVLLSVRGPDGGSMTCNLGVAAGDREGDVVFESDGAPMPAGHAITLERPAPGRPLMAYAPWLALAALGSAIAVSWVVTGRRSRRDPQPMDSPPRTRPTARPKARAGLARRRL